MKPDGTQPRPAEPPPSIAAQYEILRGAALGEPLPPEARRGLGLFLRRGMWAWARMPATDGDAAPPKGSPSRPSTAPRPTRAVIRVFAAMALNTNRGRAQ
jgi:hypothetical protein